MPGGKRTDRISERDLEVLDFVARFGIVSRKAMAVWAGTARTVTLTRERRLREADLIEVHFGFGDRAKLVTCTRLGLRAVGREDLRPGRVSLATVGHECVVAELAATLERDGGRTVSEREMQFRERVEGERLYSAKLSGDRSHRADLLRVVDLGPPEAIEVELAVKGAARLDELLRGWRRVVAEGRLSRVVYRCAPSVMAKVDRAVERTRTAAAIGVEGL